MSLATPCHPLPPLASLFYPSPLPTTPKAPPPPFTLHHHPASQVFGWPTLDGVDPTQLRCLPADSSPLAGHVVGMVEALRADRTWCWPRLKVLKQGEGDAGFQQVLIEDQTKQMMSYPEFLAHCHRYILSKVS